MSVHYGIVMPGYLVKLFFCVVATSGSFEICGAHVTFLFVLKEKIAWLFINWKWETYSPSTLVLGFNN